MPAYIVASWGGHQAIDAFRVLGRFGKGPVPGGGILAGLASRNKGYNMIHTGGHYNSYLLMPRIL